MCDRRFAWLKDAAVEMGPILLGALHYELCGKLGDDGMR